MQRSTQPLDGGRADHVVRPVRVRRRSTIQRPTIQRVIIPHAGIDGLTRNVDTDDDATTRVQILTLWNGGKLDGLTQLRAALPYSAVGLRARITWLLNKPASWDADAGNSSTAELAQFDLANPAADTTGLVNNPGQGLMMPALPTALETASIAVRSWQVGDLLDGISWSALGAHLRGTMSPADYVQLGDDLLGRRDLANGTNLQATTDNPGKSAFANAALTRVRNEIRAGLDVLAPKPGTSYRASGVQPSVYGTSINVGDYIRDEAFWSTSGMKQGHGGAGFGTDGTVAAPRAYFVIAGSTGVFLPRYTNTETGVREVLFKNRTTFRVNKIGNYANRTFIVHVEEKDPAVAPLNPVTKNSYNGAVNA